MLIRTIGVTIAACAMLAAGAAAAATIHYSAPLKGADETPPNDTTGTGQVDATFDTTSRKFDYTATYSGLTGPATMAHFHGPAAPGASAPPVVAVKGMASPMTGSAVLTPAQAADLQAGKWYFNIHTAAHPPGEIRGQLAPAS